MNSLRGLLEDFENGKLLINMTVFPQNQELLNHIRNEISRIGEAAICFDGQDIQKYSEVAINYDNIKLPYDNCWIEFTVTNIEKQQQRQAVMAIEITNNQENYIQCLVFGKYKTQGWILLNLAIISDYGRTFSLAYKGSEVNTLVSESTVIGFVTILSALNGPNIKKVEHHVSEKLTKSRAYKNKKPLFSYYTLEITKNINNKDNYLSGIGTSKRQHDRRKHKRTYKNGKVIWIEKMVVGNKKLGIIHKDYKINHKKNDRFTLMGQDLNCLASNAMKEFLPVIDIFHGCFKTYLKKSWRCPKPLTANERASFPIRSHCDG